MSKGTQTLSDECGFLSRLGGKKPPKEEPEKSKNAAPAKPNLSSRKKNKKSSEGAIPASLR